VSPKLRQPIPNTEHPSIRPPKATPADLAAPVRAGSVAAASGPKGEFLPTFAFQRTLSSQVGACSSEPGRTEKPVPDAPGLYCFVGQQNQSSELRVFYVGMTSHLWMVARGQLPGGIARGGQLYGRPKHAGTTRQRVNAEVARLAADGWTLSHWLRALRRRLTLNARGARTR
jgi:hypothetical protein